LLDWPLALLGRPLAAFLAHLIATDRRLPQSRERRRGEPQQAVAAYEATSRRMRQPTSDRDGWRG
jgi:hypothetical protein